MTIVFYNPMAHGGAGKEQAEAFANTLSDKDISYQNVLEIEDVHAYLDTVPVDARLILCGGDGTLTRLNWKLEGREIRQDLYFTSAGTGNDFMRDVQDKVVDGMIRINEYIRNLPLVYVNGEVRPFINGVGFGVDGYCCEVGDKLHAEGKRVDYTGIAIKGLLGKFKPLTAEITVDGVTKTYKNVWIAPTMKGKYYGGGLMIAPDQDRGNPDGSVTSCVMFKKSRIGTLLVFAGVSKGKHVTHTEMFEMRVGHEIHVKFNRPCALQIDGETYLNVTEYTVRAPHLSQTEGTQD